MIKNPFEDSQTDQTGDGDESRSYRFFVYTIGCKRPAAKDFMLIHLWVHFHLSCASSDSSIFFAYPELYP